MSGTVTKTRQDPVEKPGALTVEEMLHPRPREEVIQTSTETSLLAWLHQGRDVPLAPLMAATTLSQGTMDIVITGRHQRLLYTSAAHEWDRGSIVGHEPLRERLL